MKILVAFISFALIIKKLHQYTGSITKNNIMKLAIVGATGLVGNEILKVLEEFDFSVDELMPVASAASVGKKITFTGKVWPVMSLQDAISAKPDMAIFSAGGQASLDHAPQFASVGTTVIDNSSAWRMNPEHKLIVPEVNGDVLTKEDKIIANPNCSTIQMVLALSNLHDAFLLKRIVVSTYQSVTGSGKLAVDQLLGERGGNAVEKVYPHQIDLNAIPHIDEFLENGYTKEEMKMVNETKKIFDNNNIQVTATAVRLPIMGGHAESINAEFVNPLTLVETKDIISKTPGVVLEDNPQNNEYPMPLYAQKSNKVYVGRVRMDKTRDNTINLWVVADNLRKGAATNAVQIAQYLVNNNLVNG
jgi:aspartate-semialdehyde dehydrogenase